jgi:hypothetical protein
MSNKLAASQKFKSLSIIILMVLWIYSIPVLPVRAAVTVEDFLISPTGSSILVEWWTADETTNTGFYIQRSGSVSGGYQRITDFIQTEWDGIQTAYYYYFDDDVVQGVTYYYRLECLDQQGNSTFIGPAPGSSTQMLPTFTPSTSAVASRTPTPTGIQLGAATPTRTATLSKGTPATPLTTVSPLPTDLARSQTVIPDLSATIEPEETTTLEPLPTFILTFPATATADLAVKIITEIPTFVVTPEPVSESELTEPVPPRLISIGLIVLVIWLCLAAFLVFIVRQFND